ncbi:hypothetical protein APA_1340 [Pseudanabaena sp. lw0831]|nr:hypothetical protein APA_1340 [Pseudanabaena sp. lw0831]
MPAIAGAFASEASCPITKSVYRDGDGTGFELVFWEPPVGTPFHGTAIINHPQHKQIYRFIVSQSSGYGSIWLTNQDKDTINLKNDRSFGITFFDRNFKSATPLWLGKETDSPKYAIVADLGSHDYYRRRGSTLPLLGDVIWIHDRCQ